MKEEKLIHNHSLEAELNINPHKTSLDPPSLSEHLLNFNSMISYGQGGNVNHHIANANTNNNNFTGITNTMTSQMNPAVNSFGLSGDLIETLKDPLQKHLHFGPSYQEGSVLGKRRVLDDRTNGHEGSNAFSSMGYSTEKRMMFKNALDSVQLPTTGGKAGYNNNILNSNSHELGGDTEGDYNMKFGNEGYYPMTADRISNKPALNNQLNKTLGHYKNKRLL